VTIHRAEVSSATAPANSTPSEIERQIERYWVVGLLLCIIGAIAFATAFHPADRATPDTAFYIDGARHIAAGAGFSSAMAKYDEAAPVPMSKFGPGFSALMAPGLLAGLSERKSAALVLGASYSVYALAVFLLFVTAAGRGIWPIAVLATALVLVGRGSLLALDSILSDLPGTALALTGIGLATRLVSEPVPSRKTALAAGAFFALAVLVRWSGLLLLVAVGTGIWVALRSRVALGQRVRLLGWVAIAPVVSIGPWLIRNLALTGTLLGRTGNRPTDPVFLATSALEGVLTDVLDSRVLLGPDSAMETLYTGLVCAAAACGFFTLLRTRAWQHPGVALLLTTQIGYTALLLVTASLRSVDPLFNPRFWLPVWPMVWAVALALLGRVVAPRALRRTFGVSVAIPALLTLGVLGYQVAGSMHSADEGRGYFDEAWQRTADRVGAVLDERSDCSIVSNDPRALLIHHSYTRVVVLPDDTEKLLTLLEKEGTTCIVLFKRGPNSVLKRLARGRQILREVEGDLRIQRVSHDEFADIWVSS
jgi:hypothetical protein